MLVCGAAACASMNHAGRATRNTGLAIQRENDLRQRALRHHPAEQRRGLRPDEQAQRRDHQHGPARDAAKQHALAADEAHRDRAHGEVLRRDRLADHAARGVRGGEQNVGEAGVMRGRQLEHAEQRVGRGVGARERGREPAEHRRNRREGGAGARGPDAERHDLPGEIHDVRDAHDAADREHGPAQFVQILHIRAGGGAHVELEQRHRERARDQHDRAGGQQPFEFRVDGGHGRAFRIDDMQAGPRERRGQRAHRVCHETDLRGGDDENHGGVGRERAQHFGGGVARGVGESVTLRMSLRRALRGGFERRAAARHRHGERAALQARATCVARFMRGLRAATGRGEIAAQHRRRPQTQKRDRCARAEQRRDDIDEFDRQRHRARELRERERKTGDRGERPDFLEPASAVENEHEHERDEQRKQRRLASDHHADVVHRQARDLGEHGDRQAERAERDRAGVGEQADGRGLDRLHAERDQQHGADRDRRAAARERFEQRAEAERDQHGLHALIGAHMGECAAQHVGVAARLGELEQPDRIDADPDDREETDGRAFERAAHDLAAGHAVDERGDDHRHDQRGECGPARGQAQHAEQHEQRQEREGRERGGGRDGMRDRIEYLGVHASPSNASRTFSIESKETI
ncbi:hypothetical protein PT2222_80094 [Paraburkholderia tropica]